MILLEGEHHSCIMSRAVARETLLSFIVRVYLLIDQVDHMLLSAPAAIERKMD